MGHHFIIITLDQLISQLLNVIPLPRVTDRFCGADEICVEIGRAVVIM
jgi:hypothetical protein